MDWLDLLAVQGTFKSLLQHHSSKAPILWRSAFFTVQLSHPYMTTGKTIALTRGNFVGKVMSLLLNMLSRLVITFLPRSKRGGNWEIWWLDSDFRIRQNQGCLLCYLRQDTNFTDLCLFTMKMEIQVSSTFLKVHFIPLCFL